MFLRVEHEDRADLSHRFSKQSRGHELGSLEKELRAVGVELAHDALSRLYFSHGVHEEERGSMRKDPFYRVAVEVRRGHGFKVSGQISRRGSTIARPAASAFKTNR